MRKRNMYTYRVSDYRTLKNSHAPVTYRSKGLAELLGMENLYITLFRQTNRKSRWIR